MTSINVPVKAASRARGAASPATELLEPGAKRLRKRLAMGSVPLSGGAAPGDVDAAVQTGAVDGSATATTSHAVEDPETVQGEDAASIETNFDQVDLSADALAERLLLVLTRKPLPPPPLKWGSLFCFCRLYFAATTWCVPVSSGTVLFFYSKMGEFYFSNVASRASSSPWQLQALTIHAAHFVSSCRSNGHYVMCE